jgi:hypothetical protein
MGSRCRRDGYRGPSGNIGTYVIETGLQVLELTLLDNQVILVIQILHNVVMALLVVLEDHRFDRGIALDEQT